MRRIATLCLIPMLAATPIVAQGFEGTVMLKMGGDGGGPKEATYLVKGDKLAILIAGDASMGPMAGKEIRMILDRNTLVMTMLIPMEMGDTKGMKMVIDTKKESAKLKPVEVKALGTSETIAGYKCDNFSVTEGKNVTTLCLAAQLGAFVFPQGGMGRGGSGPSWVAALASHPGFPLRVTANGKVDFEVTSVQPGKISSDEFAVPDGYRDMSGMMGGRGRGGNR